MEPEDDYLVALGRAHYLWGYLEWSIVHILDKWDEVSPAGLAHKSGGQIAGAFRSTVEDHPERQALSAAFDVLVERRNDIAHARPATLAEGQRLYRWMAPENGRAKAEEMNLDELARFTAEVRGAMLLASGVLHPPGPE